MGNLRLSEAIRLGAMTTRQGFGQMNNGPEITCALGSALHSIGKLSNFSITAHAGEYWPWLKEPLTCPACGIVVSDYEEGYWTITHLNDIHEWTREEIADFVATLEPETIESATPVAEVREESHAAVNG